jgi:hypothetical protein
VSNYLKDHQDLVLIQMCKLIDMLIIYFSFHRFDCVGLFYNDNSNQMMLREWIIPLNSFDNLLYSMINLFEITTLEDWPTPCFRTIDGVGEDLGPIINNRQYVALYYVAFIFITDFFVMNLFVSVIVDKFNEEIKKKDGSHNFTEE